MWGGFYPWCCFEDCNTRGQQQSSSLFERHMTLTVLVGRKTKTSKKQKKTEG
jgi:hypothetical protein